MSRQTLRQFERMQDKVAAHYDKLAARKTAQRERLERQTEREKNGFYSARGVAWWMTGSRSTPIDQRKIAKRKPFGRILHSLVIDGVEIAYHATKGWRRHNA